MRMPENLIELSSRVKARKISLGQGRFSQKRVPTKQLYNQLGSSIERSKKLIRVNEFINHNSNQKINATEMKILAARMNGLKSPENDPMFRTMLQKSSSCSTIDLKSIRKDLEKKYERFIEKVLIHPFIRNS